MKDLSRRNLFGCLTALGGLPLIAKEIEAPEKLILDPGEVVRFDSLAGNNLQTYWNDGQLAAIPVTWRAARLIQSLKQTIRSGGLIIQVTKDQNGKRAYCLATFEDK